MKHVLWAVALLFATTAGADAKVVGKTVTYDVKGAKYTGYLAYDDAIQGKRPAVLVVHEWWGHNPYARRRADMLARLGYTAFALDMYGSGKLAKHPKDAKEFMTTMFSSGEVADRFGAAKAILEGHDTVKTGQTAAIGYCMGGAIVLGMARAGMDLKAVASFHGSLAAKADTKPGAVKAEVLVMNGADDPFVKPEHIAAFKADMDNAGTRYEFINYADTVHSFTNPDADEFGRQFNMPLRYNGKVEEDSWRRMQVLFNKAFAD